MGGDAHTYTHSLKKYKNKDVIKKIRNNKNLIFIDCKIWKLCYFFYFYHNLNLHFYVFVCGCVSVYSVHFLSTYYKVHKRKICSRDVDCASEEIIKIKIINVIKKKDRAIVIMGVKSVA